jgi:protein gp37
MAKETKIQWCDSTFNPWWGCAKVSPGCDNCYAADIAKRFKRCEWGAGKPRVRTSQKNWDEVLKWNEKARETGVRTRIFCGSMCDWLDPEVPVDWLTELLYLIWSTPNLDWLLLSKRPELWAQRMHEVIDRVVCVIPGLPPAWLSGNSPENIWLGTTVENQEQANKRIPELLKIPAKVHFLSCEPLLGEINIRAAFPADHHIADISHGGQNPADIDWVICGCESGAKRRPMDINAALSLQRKCHDAKVPFFMKQMETFNPVGRASRNNVYTVSTDIENFPNQLQVRQFPTTNQ